MSAPKILLTAVTLTALSSACAIRHDLETAFTPPSDKPAIDVSTGDVDPTHGTKFCSPDASGAFDETAIAVQTGLNDSDGSAWAEGGGCVLRPIRETWAALNNLEVTKFEAADRFSYTRTINPKPGFTHLYEITYFKSTIIGELDWTIDWYHGVDQGTFEAPEEVNIDYQRTRGTSNIPIWHGGIVLTRVNNGVTSIAIRNEFKARQSSSSNKDSASDALKEMIGDARTAKPDWERLNTGLKDNPAEPDKPTTGHAAAQAKKAYCVKDATGAYPTKPDTTNSSENGISTFKVRACVPLETAALFAATKNHAAIRWTTASGESVTVNGDANANPLNETVWYEKSRFLRSAIRWDMAWEYSQAPAAANGTPTEEYSVTYKVDPATADYPVWDGKITLSQIEPGVTAVEIDNNLLIDSVSKSLAVNTDLTMGLLGSLTNEATPKPVAAVRR